MWVHSNAANWLLMPGGAYYCLRAPTSTGHCLRLHATAYCLPMALVTADNHRLPPAGTCPHLLLATTTEHSMMPHTITHHATTAYSCLVWHDTAYCTIVRRIDAVCRGAQPLTQTTSMRCWPATLGTVRSIAAQPWHPTPPHRTKTPRRTRPGNHRTPGATGLVRA